MVQCEKCGNEQIIYSMTNNNILCKVCDALIAEKTGGKAKIHAVILRRLD
jgi:ribosomal protein S27E|tara:strand:+ start:289 stop:438 length:150 start_codon:yes stop_codon:yes gene_type:complete